MGRVLVISNPRAGQDAAEDVRDSLRDALARLREWDSVIRETTGAQDAMAWAAAAESEGFDRVLAVGGDGTVTEAAEGLLRSESFLPLGVVPSGTANVLGESLRISANRAEAVVQALTGDARAFDVGYLPELDRYFLIGVGIGIPGKTVENADRKAKDRFGFAAYLFAFLEGLAEGRTAVLKVESGEDSFAASGQSAVVANLARAEILGRPLGMEISPHDGALDCMILDHSDAGLLVEAVAKLLGGGLEETSALVHRRARRFRIEANPVLSVQVDGEWIGRTPVEVELAKRPVHLVVGPDYEDPESAGVADAGGESL